MQLQLEKTSFLYEYLLQIEKENLFGKALKQANAKYDLSSIEIGGLTQSKMLKKIQKLVQKYCLMKDSTNQNRNYEQVWLQNEKCIFYRLLLCYIYKNNKDIKQLDDSDYKKLCAFMHHKNINFIRYYTLILLKDNKSKSWTQNQDDALKEVMLQNDFSRASNDWSQVSRKIFIQSGSIKIAKQCRQRWFNHLNPLCSKQWTLQQDLVLFNFIKQRGKKWAKIAVELNSSKNQHSIKNRYNSIMKKRSKRYYSKKQNQIVEMILEELRDKDRKDVIIKQNISTLIPQKFNPILTLNNQQEMNLLISQSINLEQSHNPIFNDNERHDFKFLESLDLVKEQKFEEQFMVSNQGLKLYESIRLQFQPSPAQPTPFSFDTITSINCLGNEQIGGFKLYSQNNRSAFCKFDLK